MEDFKPGPGTFRAYLEARNRDTAPRPGPLTLLEILSRQSQQTLPMFDLQAQSRMEPARYADALKSLRDARYIEIAGGLAHGTK
jgi:hypothetical protein